MPASQESRFDCIFQLKVGYAEQEELKRMVSYYSSPTDPGWEQQWSLVSKFTISAVYCDSSPVDQCPGEFSL